MGFMHISNLYRPEAQDILRQPELYALEKVHGTSAHVRWNGEAVSLFSGGEKADTFAALFDVARLAAAFKAYGQPDVVVYGEAYGGKCQGMSHTYGKALRFIAFDVKVGGKWLDVPEAVEVAMLVLGLEFVPYARIPTTLPAIDGERDKPSEVAKRRGITEDKIREGVVLRPLAETVNHRGERLIAKHKRIEFLETRTAREVDPSRLVMLQEAEAIAAEWVTPMRLAHVLDKLVPPATGPERTGDVVRAMIEDVLREGEGELADSQQTKKAIGQAAARLFKGHLNGLIAMPDGTSAPAPAP